MPAGRYGLQTEDARRPASRALFFHGPVLQQAVDPMLQEIRRDPEHIIDSMRAELARRSRAD